MEASRSFTVKSIDKNLLLNLNKVHTPHLCLKCSRYKLFMKYDTPSCTLDFYNYDTIIIMLCYFKKQSEYLYLPSSSSVSYVKDGRLCSEKHFFFSTLNISFFPYGSFFQKLPYDMICTSSAASQHVHIYFRKHCRRYLQHFQHQCGPCFKIKTG